MALVPINWVSQRCVIDRSLHVSYAILAIQLPLERILRHLATHHVFQEVSPGVFSHNLLSSLLDTGKDFEVIKKECVGSTLPHPVVLTLTCIVFSPDAKFDDTNGLAAFASLL